MDKEQMLSKARLLLGITDSSADEILLFLIDDCVSRVLGYCRRKDFPAELESTVPIMAVHSYRLNGYGTVEGNHAVIQITQGDRTVAFESSEIVRDDWINDFKERLEPFRIRRGRLPSELDESI